MSKILYRTCKKCGEEYKYTKHNDLCDECLKKTSHKKGKNVVRYDLSGINHGR